MEGWEVSLRPPPPELEPLDLRVPGDFSSAAFLVAFALLGGVRSEFRIPNVGLNPTRTGLLDVLKAMGAGIEVESVREVDDPRGEPAGDLVVSPSELRGTSVSGRQIPLLIDEIPVLAAMAARADGVTEIRDAEELRYKESDRIRALAENLAGIGVQVTELPDGLRIVGGKGTLGGEVRARHDHRIAMAFGVLGALGGNRISLDDRAVTEVSFPGFWRLLSSLRQGSGL